MREERLRPVLTNKEKRYLKALGGKLEPVVQIGKAGVAPSVVAGAAGVIAGRELIKVRVLKNSPEEPAEAIARLAEGVGAELVQVIGRNGLLFKRNPEKPKIEFPVVGAAAAAARTAPPSVERPAKPKPRGGAKPFAEKTLAQKPRGRSAPAAAGAFGPKPRIKATPATERAFGPKPRGAGKPAADGAYAPKPRSTGTPAADRVFAPKPRGAGKPAPGLKKDGREKNYAYQAEPGRGQTDRRQSGVKHADPQHRQAKSAGNRKAGAGTVRSGKPGQTNTAGHVRRGGGGHGPAGAKRKT